MPPLEELRDPVNESEHSGAVTAPHSRSLPGSDGFGEEPALHDDAIREHFSGVDDTILHLAEDVQQLLSVYKYSYQQLTGLLNAKDESEKKMEGLLELQHPEKFGVPVLRLNVGGELFTVPIATLTKDDNTYFQALLYAEQEGVSEAFRDEMGNIFIDRDPVIFRYILNYLRGYTHFQMLPEDQVHKLKVDAHFFQLSGLVDLLHDMDQSAELQFQAGPGVSPERTRLRVVYGIAIIGDGFLVTGRHRITIEVVVADYVGVGLVSDACVSTDQEFHKTANSCVYYMSGVFYTNFPHHRKEENHMRIENGDYISVLVDMDRGFAEFSLKDYSKMISIGRARRLRFATTLKLSSRVRIVPEEEAVKLPLLQKKTHKVTGIPLFSNPRLNPSIGFDMQ